MQAFQDLMRAAKDPQKMKIWLTAHQGSLKAWGGFMAMVFVIYHLFSDGDFSFLMTLSSLISMFTFLMMVVKIEKSKSCAGVSLKMIELYVIVIFARLCSIVPFEGYLPYDRSGDWLYQTVEAICLCLAGSIVWLCRSRYAHTYDPSSDSIKQLLLIVPSFAFSLVFHPSLNAFTPADVAWAFALYLESVTVVPQLFMFLKEGKVEPFTTHFLAGQALSKLLSFVFWVSSYSELNGPRDSIKSYVGMWVIGTQVFQLIVMGDFIFHYVLCLYRGVPVQFILTENV